MLNNLTTNLRKLSSLLLGEPYYPAYQRFLRRCFAAHAQRLGWDAKPGEYAFAGHLRYRATHATHPAARAHDDTHIRRATVLSELGANGDETVIAEAQKRFALHTSGTALLPAESRPFVFGLVRVRWCSGVYLGRH